MLVDLVIVRPDEFSGSETSALSENPARNFINIISEIDIGTSVCVCVCVCEREIEGGNIIFKKKIHFSNP